MGIPVVEDSTDALHLAKHAEDRVPVVPRVLEHVRVVDPAIHLTRVSDEVIDFIRNVPRRFAIPIHTAGRIFEKCMTCLLCPRWRVHLAPAIASISRIAVILEAVRLLLRAIRSANAMPFKRDDSA